MAELSANERVKENLRSHLALWRLALRVEARRLSEAPGLPDVQFEVHLALVTLRNAVRWADLAVKLFAIRGALRAHEKFESSDAVKDARNVFEHFDDYFLGAGRLQRALDRPDEFVVQIASGYAEEGGRSPTVSVGGRELALLEVMNAAEDMLWEIDWAIRRS